MTLKCSQATSRKFRGPHESLLIRWTKNGWALLRNIPDFYKSFVDDIFTIVPGIATAETLHQALDNSHLPLSFTIEDKVEGKLPFLGMIIRKENTIHTKVYIKLTNTGLLQHYQSMDKQYKRSSLRTLLQKEPTARQKPQVTRIVLPFRCQLSANTVRCQTSELSSRISVQLPPLFTSLELNHDLKPMEQKPAQVNKQKVVYHFQCDQREDGYVCDTLSQHLHQRVDKHGGKTTIIQVSTCNRMAAVTFLAF